MLQWICSLANSLFQQTNKQQFFLHNYYVERVLEGFHHYVWPTSGNRQCANTVCGKYLHTEIGSVNYILCWMWTNLHVDWDCCYITRRQKLKTNSAMPLYHDDIIKWNTFHITGPLCGVFTGHCWIPLTKASDAELWCFLWSVPE